METIPKKAVRAVAVVLAALALLGLYQGWRRSSADEVQAADGSLLPATTAVTGARQASALVEAPAQPLTEAQVREIARQEVRATLRGDNGASSESAPATAADAAAAGGAARPATAAPGAPRPAPAAPQPQAPAAAPAEAAPEPGGAAPLF